MLTEIGTKAADGSIPFVKFVAENADDKKQLVHMLEGFKEFYAKKPESAPASEPAIESKLEPEQKEEHA
jgi:hypothetical protein